MTQGQVVCRHFPIFPPFQLSILVLETTKTKNVYLSPCLKHRINQTRKTINALNSIWWHKDITKKNRKLYIYQTIIQSILMYGAEV
jgi:hypothetical protein